jgi:hypothetical protein
MKHTSQGRAGQPYGDGVRQQELDMVGTALNETAGASAAARMEGAAARVTGLGQCTQCTLPTAPCTLTRPPPGGAMRQRTPGATHLNPWYATLTYLWRSTLMMLPRACSTTVPQYSREPRGPLGMA